MDVEIRYHTASLDDVLRYFAKDFEIKDGRKIVREEHYVDVAKDTVVFKLTISEIINPGERDA